MSVEKIYVFYDSRGVEYFEATLWFKAFYIRSANRRIGVGIGCFLQTCDTCLFVR